MAPERSRIVLFAYSAGAILGLAGIVQGALFAAVSTSGSPWMAFLATVVIGGALWAGFTFGAYEGLTSPRLWLKFVFWLYVTFNIFAFPVGTAVSAALIWSWRTERLGRA